MNRAVPLGNYTFFLGTALSFVFLSVVVPRSLALLRRLGADFGICVIFLRADRHAFPATGSGGLSLLFRAEQTRTSLVNCKLPDGFETVIRISRIFVFSSFLLAVFVFSTFCIYMYVRNGTFLA